MIRRLLAAVAALCVMLSIATPAQAARFYVDNKLGNVANRATLTAPGPVQVVVEFQINGARNERGTKDARKMVMAELAKLPYLPQVSDKPAANGALLTVKINNIFSEAERKAAMKSAFASGFTFGASDTIVRDTGAAPVASEVKHSLITTLGKGSDASFGIEYKKPNEAVSVLLGQTLDHGLDAIARQVAP
jgi:hypothetical protein